MTAGRGTAVAIALLGAALAAAGCGLGPGSGEGDVELTVTRDYGTVPMLHRQLGDVTEADTVMRVLERSAEITTTYGGDFVQSIDGVESRVSGGHYFDWIFYLNGVESNVGAGAYDVHGGDSVWWDYRDWSAALHVPVVVGSWPEPLVHGYSGKRRPVGLECRGAAATCGQVRERLVSEGVRLGPASRDGAIRILVGPWARLRGDPAAAQIERGVEASGVYAALERSQGGYRLEGLDVDGQPARSFGANAGLVAATRHLEEPPVWVVTGSDAAGVRAAAGILDARDLRDRYAVAVEGGEVTALPLP
jgi:hypothetical protein